MPNRPNLFAEIMQGAARAATAGIANRRNFLNQQAPIPSTSSAPSMLSGLMAAPQAPQNTLDIRRALQTPSPGFPPQGGGVIPSSTPGLLRQMQRPGRFGR
jgi:hypothetical protein